MDDLSRFGDSSDEMALDSLHPCGWRMEQLILVDGVQPTKVMMNFQVTALAVH